MAKKNILAALFSMTDEQAMWRVQRADDYEAFARLVERWDGPIRELCRRMLGDAHRGEDLKQEALARAFEKRKEYQPTGKFSTWLWRIALNLCYDELRRMNRRSESSLEIITEADMPAACIDSETPDQQMAEQEEGEMVRAALLRLPETYRAVVVLRHYEGLKLREIAEVLQIPKGTVVTRLAEAYARMTRVLEPRMNQEAQGKRKQSYESSRT
jgi:RNA polymerase sigma-70 factor, ECF subfamily